MVSKAPKLLFFDVSKTLKPKFQCLMDLGLFGPEMVNLMAKDATIIERGLVTHLRPVIDCLRSILGCDDNVVKALKRAPWYITQKPEWVKDLVHRVENEFRVPCDSPSFLYGFKVLASQKKSTLDRKFRIFKIFGWSCDDILQMFQKLPFCVALSEVRIQRALNLFMKELGFETAFIVSRPTILSFSLEKRVVPRLNVLKSLDEKKFERKKLALYIVLSLTESKFLEHFVLPYKDQIPDLSEPLKKIMAS
ncbi:hypothetical protein K7X08_023763 [Anisodus acutangulus]|uniref:Mitochondrial transcription termination factor family protein n=1 Tax=Anisodus acutangulus TaxID=402998 RepID=A0A9Q1L7T7_9SOLA|nr:hypothetical protein K7X08_023763 [Anisodus acutangulus]